jgi:hypothetical protein
MPCDSLYPKPFSCSDIWNILDQQFNRLSALEKQVMFCLATNPEWVTLPQLLEAVVPTVSYRELLEALESLQQRSLIERSLASFTQQTVVMEYVAQRGAINLTPGRGVFAPV